MPPTPRSPAIACAGRNTPRDQWAHRTEFLLPKFLDVDGTRRQNRNANEFQSPGLESRCQTGGNIFFSAYVRWGTRTIESTNRYQPPAQHLGRVIAHMPRNVKFAIHRLLREGYSIGEIAATLDVRVGKVRRLMAPQDVDAAPAIERWDESEELSAPSGRTRSAGAHLPRNVGSAMEPPKKTRKRPRKRKPGKAQSQALEITTLRRLWELATCPKLATILSEADTAVETLSFSSEPVRFPLAKAYVRRIAGVLPLPLPAGRGATQSLAIVDTAENSLAFVVDRLADGTARFCGAANRPRRVETALAQKLGTGSTDDSD